MAQRSMFFDAVSGDRSYDAASLAALLRALVQRDGVVYGYGGGLAVAATDPASMNVTVATGAAFVQGRMFEVHTAGETLAIGAADPVNPRIDRIVIKLDNSSAVRNVSLAVKAGTPAASPAPPTLQRDGTVWELSLAQVYVAAGATSISSANITDERADATLCGNAFGFLSPTTGHKHTGAAGDGPKIDPSAFDTTAWPAFRAYQSTVQSLGANTWTKVAYQTEVYDQGNVFDNAAYRFTAPNAGFYLFTASVAFTGTTDGARRYLSLYVNGAEHTRIIQEIAGAAVTQMVSGSAHLKLSAGDYVEVFALSSINESLSPDPKQTIFLAIRLA